MTVASAAAEASSGEHSNLSTIGFAIGFVLMMVLDVVMGWSSFVVNMVIISSCKYVIHTVGPIIPNGIPTEFQKEQLASCYLSIMACAEENRLESIAFCCISTGEFRFPNQLAAEIAVQTIKDYLTTHYDSSIKQLVFNVFKDVDKEIYQQILG